VERSAAASGGAWRRRPSATGFAEFGRGRGSADGKLRSNPMAVLIHVHQGVRTLYLTFCQRLVQFEKSDDPADTKISRETFPDPVSANNALHAGKVSWESFDWDDDELRINAVKELYAASTMQSRK
jgi:hypothetical protein